MDNMMFSIKDFLVSFIISVKPFLAIIFTAFSFCSTILTCIGKSLPGILISPKNLKYREVLKYKIIKAQRDMKYDIDFIKPSISLLIEIFKIFEVLLAICIFLYFVAPFIEGNETKENKIAYSCIWACIFIFCLSALISKIVKKESVPSIYYKIVFLLTGNFFGLFILVCFLNNNGIMIYMMLTCISIYNFVIMEIDFFTDKNNYITRKLKISRFIGGISYIIYFFVSAKTAYGGHNVNMCFLYSWMILCLIENTISTIIMNDVPRVEFQIDLKNGKVHTKNTIYQYQCNKVKYALEDGSIEIINDNQIKSIDYTKRNYINTKKKAVVCILKTKEKINFDGYKFIKDCWVSFYNIDDKGKHIKVINMNRIKKIVIN